MGGLSDKLQKIQLEEQKLKASKFMTLEKALRSNNPDDLIKASEIINAIQSKSMEDNSKSFFIDPLQFNANLGYKDKPYSLSYTTLKRMSKAPIINSIIKTRKNQVADFADAQENKYSTGFIIRKKAIDGVLPKMSEKEKKVTFQITDFLLKGGNGNAWMQDDFDTFIRKIVEDSLVYDQMTFECIRNRKGDLEYFLATDASTFRISDSYFEKDYKNSFFDRNNINKNSQEFGKKKYGYYPSFVQVYQTTKINEFYPWELCFAVRNASTSIYSNGYGTSELEDLINTVTSMLWGDEYNRRFFSQGSAPKGLLRVKGTNNESALQQFKQQWQSMITGVMQSWKTPIVQADVDWIDLQKNNRDMEYSSWMEYLIKIACAIYTIDPTEIGWDISRGGGSSLFEGSQEQRLKHSKDKGLYPLLKFLQRKINRYIVEQINPEYELVFMGLNGLSIEDELKMDIDKLNSFMTVNEIRDKYELKPIEEGDSPNNSVYLQAKNMSQQQAMQQQMQETQGNFEEENPFDAYSDYDDEEEENPFDAYSDDETEKSERNELFIKAFDNFLEKEENKKDNII